MLPQEGPATMAGYPDKRARTRAALVRGAMEVLGRGGSDALTVAAVTGAAGVSHGTLYNHVEGTAELAGIVADELAAVLERGAEHLAESSRDPASLVALGVVQLLATPRTDRVFAAAFVAAMADGRSFPNRVRDLVRRTVIRGMRAGTFDVPDADAASDAVVGAVVQTLRGAVLDERPLDAPATAELCLRLLGMPSAARTAALDRSLAAEVPA